ncbi:MAG: hypothetical protein JWM76_1313 [Pseudonocardiales bacterium]|nr:hypothetical protein [Pseudonocardiales bacterium]
MIPEDFHEFLVAIDGVAGALIGLLFVAVSLAPRRLRDPMSAHLAQTQASTALLVFTNTLTLGLLALLPGIDMGVATLVVASIGVVYCIALARLTLTRSRVDQKSARSMRGIVQILVILTASEMWSGIQLASDGTDRGGTYWMCSTMVAALLFGISRAWELVGLPSNSLFHSLSVLHDPGAADRAEGPEDPGGGT